MPDLRADRQADFSTELLDVLKFATQDEPNLPVIKAKVEDYLRVREVDIKACICRPLILSPHYTDSGHNLGKISGARDELEESGFQD